MSAFVNQLYMGYPEISMRNVAQYIPATGAQPIIRPGTIAQGASNWWGGAEFIYARANAAIRAQGLCVITPVFNSTLNTYLFNATEVPNTANLGRMLAVAMGSFLDTQYGWFMISGMCPVNCSASVAADTTFGITAAGQAGANTAGKQILNARVMVAGAATVAKTGCVAANASRLLTVPNDDGWFVGVYLSGTGIAAGTTVASIDSSGRNVVLSADTTAAVSGTVTATYNNATIFYNVAHLNQPFAQGAIT